MKSINPALLAVFSPFAASLIHAQCPPSFGSADNYLVGSTPSCVAVADFDGDGRLDLAVPNYGSGTISVLLGNADGSFQTALNHAMCCNPWCVAVGDFNRDGRPDLAVSNYLNTVSILLGNGDGSFYSAPDCTVGVLPDTMAVGDLNSDGKSDLAVPNRQDDNVSILLGRGDGTFQAAANYPVGDLPFIALIADFNRDGDPDLATSNYGGDVSILLGDGNGTFQMALAYSAGIGPRCAAVGDFNRDGAPDLVVVNATYYSNVSLLLGNGDGSFQPPVSYAAGKGTASFVTVEDLNDDGNQDLAVTNFDDTVSVLLGDGRGTFQNAIHSSVGRLPYCVATGDFNGDHRPDLAVANQSSGSVSVLLNRSGPPRVTRPPARATSQSGESASFSVTAAGSEPITYQWRRDGVALSNGGTISGAHTPTLSIQAVALKDCGAAFDCVVTDTCGTTRSDPAGLCVLPSCIADSNQDGQINSQDFFDFLAAFFRGC